MQVGLQWMLSLYNNKLNGILADEMGLGKTVQVRYFDQYYFRSLGFLTYQRPFGAYKFVYEMS